MNITKLNKWLKLNGFDTKVSRGNDFAYVTADEEIILGSEEPGHMKQYLKYCHKLGLKRELDINLICFLHELGHHETIWDIPDWVCLIDREISYILSGDSNTELERDIRCNLYYRMSVERLATKWVINFINNNPDKVNELEVIFNGRRRSSNGRR